MKRQLMTENKVEEEQGEGWEQHEDTPVMNMRSNGRDNGRKKSFLFILIIFFILVVIGYGIVSVVGNEVGYEAVNEVNEAGNEVGEVSEVGEEIITEEQQAAQEELVEVLKRTSKLIILPEGETPIMATVIDALALRAEQPFYANVVEGDKVLVYLENQQAIIYSPKRNIVVNVGPIQFQNSAEE